MDCYSFDRIISDYIDANLNGKKRQEADQHMSECPECRKKLNDLTGILNELHDLPAVKTRPDFETRLMARIEKSNGRKESPLVRIFQDYSRPISVVAAVMLLVAASLFVYTSVVIPNEDGKIPSADIRSIENTTMPAATASARPVLAGTNSQTVLPDSNKAEVPEYNKQIMMVSENK